MLRRARIWVMLPLAIVVLAILVTACGEEDGAVATTPAGAAATPAAATATTATATSEGITVSGAWARGAVVATAAGTPGADTSATPYPNMGNCMQQGTGTPGMGQGMGASSAGGTNSAVFMVIENNSDTEQRLISAASDVATVVEIHETTMVDGTMRMRPVEGGIVVPAQGAVELKPRGLHVMLIGLNQELNEGDTIALTLTFESGLTVNLDAVEVRQP
ncbi:MAG TPA: copper chaperone PCu(A)C [Thermomicrobiales bacterium]|nr:copper chaperone PCu(A)C [Thermomicrobiales bacterium]